MFLTYPRIHDTFMNGDDNNSYISHAVKRGQTPPEKGEKFLLKLHAAGKEAPTLRAKAPLAKWWIAGQEYPGRALVTKWWIAGQEHLGRWGRHSRGFFGWLKYRVGGVPSRGFDRRTLISPLRHGLQRLLYQLSIARVSHEVPM
jgi:hypothetical protein